MQLLLDLCSLNLRLRKGTSERSTFRHRSGQPRTSDDPVMAVKAQAPVYLYEAGAFINPLPPRVLSRAVSFTRFPEICYRYGSPSR
jgi:hypothetical protein